MKATLFVYALIALSLPLSGASAARHASHVRAQDRALSARAQAAPQTEPMFHGFANVREAQRPAPTASATPTARKPTPTGTANPPNLAPERYTS